MPQRPESLSMKLSAPIRQQRPPIPPPDPMHRLLSPFAFFMVALCLAAIVFAVYAPALNFQFILDDHHFISDPRLQSSGHVWEYFANYAWAQFAGGPISFYRPLFILWLRFNFIVCGLSPSAWHLLSIAKHVAAAFLLGLLAWKLLHDRIGALLAAALFALHPAQTESVAWVTVPDPLMSGCILLTLFLYLRYAIPSSGSPGAGKKERKSARIMKDARPSALWLVASALACLAAMLAKETAIVLPVVIFSLALVLPRGAPSLKSAEKDRIPAPVTLLAHALRQTLPFLGVTALYLLLRFHALGRKLAPATQNLPWRTLLLTSPATLWFYIKALLWPVHAHAFADPNLVETFSGREVLLPGLGVAFAVAVLAALLLWAWRTAQRDLPPQDVVGVKCALVIGTLLLVLPMVPALNLNVLNPGDFLHGRYIYLSSAGLMLLLATAWRLSGRAHVPLLCAAGVLVVGFATLALSQEKQWKDDLTVFTFARQQAPHNASVAKSLSNAQVQAALQLAGEGLCSDAMPVFQQVSAEYPQDWFAWVGLGICFAQANDLPRAEESLHRAADLSHEPRVIEQWQQVRAEMLKNPPQ